MRASLRGLLASASVLLLSITARAEDTDAAKGGGGATDATDTPDAEDAVQTIKTNKDTCGLDSVVHGSQTLKVRRLKNSHPAVKILERLKFADSVKTNIELYGPASKSDDVGKIFAGYSIFMAPEGSEDKPKDSQGTVIPYIYISTEFWKKLPAADTKLQGASKTATQDIYASVYETAYLAHELVHLLEWLRDPAEKVSAEADADRRAGRMLFGLGVPKPWVETVFGDGDLLKDSDVHGRPSDRKTRAAAGWEEKAAETTPRFTCTFEATREKLYFLAVPNQAGGGWRLESWEAGRKRKVNPSAGSLRVRAPTDGKTTAWELSLTDGNVYSIQVKPTKGASHDILAGEVVVGTCSDNLVEDE